MATPVDRRTSDYEEPVDHDLVELTEEEEASRAPETGYMAWVLAIGFALAGIGLGLTALLS